MKTAELLARNQTYYQGEYSDVLPSIGTSIEVILMPFAARHYARIASALALLWVLLLLVLILDGCGGAPANAKAVAVAQKPEAQAHASFADPRLQALWVEAHQAIATQPIILNAAYVAERRDVVNDTRPADRRALDVWPDGVTVSTVADLTVAELQAENVGDTLKHFVDPTGVIHAPDGASARYCHSYTQGNAIVVAQSMLDNAGATGYEMQNVILARLGHDTRKR